MTDPILKITDGTIEFDLLNSTYGLSLNTWRQQLINFKNGGTYRDNPLADQRRLVDTKWANAIETLTVKDKNVDVDTLIEATQNLLRLLEKAVDYWTTDWQNTPVFLVARAACETNARYALIVNYRLPDLPSPYEQPFLQPGGEPTWDDYDIILEREHWTKNQPGTGTAVPISATSTYNSITYGNVDSDEDRETVTGTRQMYIANKHNEANITHIFRDDGGVFSANLVGGGLPFNLLPAAAIAVNDAVYFGIDTTVSDSGPFNNIVLDVGTAGAGYDGIWEIWTGAAWVAMVEQDNTDNEGIGDGASGIPFDTTGTRMVKITSLSSAWTTTIVNGVTAYWLRMRVTSAPGGYVSPTQQNREVYSTTWPYFEIQAADLGGDIAAIGRLELTNESSRSNIDATDGYSEGFIIGTRSVSRGSNFTAFINAADEQNPSGMTVALSGSPWSSFATDSKAPSGRVVSVVPTGAGTDTELFTVTLDNTITDEYKGIFRMFLRAARTVGAVDDITLGIRVQTNNGSGPGTVTLFSLISKTIPQESGADEGLLDFGILDLSTTLGDGKFVEIDITVFATSVSSTPRATIYDIILIPTDEYSGQFIQGQNFGRFASFDDTQYMRVDSLVKKYDMRASTHNFTSGDTVMTTQAIAPPFQLSPNTRMRAWILSIRNDGKTGRLDNLFSVSLTANQRYLSMRGER